MKTIKHKFVEFVPEHLEFGVIYISIKYKTAVHSCICGCGNKVITPLTPTDWRLTFNGQSVSLYPSIGNWNFDCKSHYWIKENKIRNADIWDDYEIKNGRNLDKNKKRKHYRKKKWFSLFQFFMQ